MCSQVASNIIRGNGDLSQLQLLTSLTASLPSLIDSVKSNPSVINQNVSNSAAVVWSSSAAGLGSNNADSINPAPAITGSVLAVHHHYLLIMFPLFYPFLRFHR